MIGVIKEPYRLISDIPGYEEFEGYAIGHSSAVYSLKQFRLRKIRIYYSNKDDKCPKVTLYSKNYKKGKNLSVRRIMAAAFLLHDGKKESKRLYLKNPLDHKNLSINNLYYKKKRRIERNVIIESKEIDLDDDLISELKTLYLATQMKGIPGVSNNLNLFVRDLIKESINDYVSQKGLRKILFQLNSES